MRHPCAATLDDGRPCPETAERSAYCRAHRLPRDRARDRARGTPTARGYGPAYQRARARILDGATVCELCGRPPTAKDPLTADHVLPLPGRRDTVGPLRPAHRSCNSRRGARTSRAHRIALDGRD